MTDLISRRPFLGPADAGSPPASPAAGAGSSRTRVPVRGPAGPPRFRRLGGARGEDVLDVLGAAACALCVTALLWGRLAPLSGWVGFAVFAYVLFLIAYTVLTQLRADGPAVRDRLATVVMWSAAVILFGVLAFVVLFTLVRGWRALVHVNFFTQDMTFAGPLQPLSVGGIKHAIVGTLWMIGIALALTVPLGIACAVFLTQVGGIGARFVRMIVEAMTALPDVVAGLFIYATWVLILGFGRSGLAAALALATAVLPIITRAADVVLRVVPGSLREASEALGAPRWRTVWHVILPTARSGLATAVILGAARGIGETAPVLLTAGYTATMNTNPLSGPMVSLPLAVFEFVRSPQPAMIERGFAAAAFLMLLVLALFALGRVLGGRAPGHLTRGSAARAKRRSARDSARIASRQRYRDRYPDRVSTTVFPVPPGLADPGGRS